MPRDSAPLSSRTRAQSRRAARSLAIVGNCSSVAARRNSRRAAASSTGRPASTRARRRLRTDPHRVAELLDVGGPLVVDDGRVDHEAEHAGPRRERRLLAGRRPGVEAEVGAGGELAAGGVGQEALGVDPVEDDRREVEQDALQQRRPVGSGPGAEPQRRDATLQVDQGVLVGRDLGADLPPADPRRAATRDEAVEQVRSAERADVDAVERLPGQLPPGRRVGVLVGHPPGLAEDGGSGLLPVGARPVVVGRRESERTGFRSELVGLVEPTLHVGHGPSVGAPLCAEPADGTFATMSGPKATYGVPGARTAIG